MILPVHYNSLPAACSVPQIIQSGGEHASRRFTEFFAASIRNRGTRQAYLHATTDFLNWCDQHQLTLGDIAPLVVATYIEQIGQHLSPPTVKLRLAAIRSLMDFLVIGQVLPFNPAASVRGPKHVAKKGKTPVLSGGEAKQLIESINVQTITGLRDRAIIGVMVYSFARVSATLGMNCEDYFQQGRRMWFRLHEKGGKYHEVPAHHTAEEYVDAYLTAACPLDKSTPLFRTIGPTKTLTQTRLHRTDVLRMIKKRAEFAGLPDSTCCHSWRATGITNYLQNGGTLEHAMQIACHESARTTKLYDRTNDAVSLDEIERIRL